MCCLAHGELAWLFLEPDTGLDQCPRILLSCFRARTSASKMRVSLSLTFPIPSLLYLSSHFSFILYFSPSSSSFKAGNVEGIRGRRKMEEGGKVGENFVIADGLCSLRTKGERITRCCCMQLLESLRRRELSPFPFQISRSTDDAVPRGYLDSIGRFLQAKI